MNHVIQSYENNQEEQRLTTNNARRIEFLTTIKAFEAIFPKEAKLLDCAAGTGIYAFHLAEKGYEVTALDLTPRHVDYMRNALKDKDFRMNVDVNDATDLSRFADETFDIVLCMGPIYHLVDEHKRLTCLNECIRVLKQGGLLVTSYISRFYVFQYVALSNTTYLKSDLEKQLIETGRLLHDDPYCFWTDTYYATPNEMETVYQMLNLEVIDHLAVDGLSPMLKDKIDQFDEAQFKIWCDYHYSICREKSVLGASNHGLIIGRK